MTHHSNQHVNQNDDNYNMINAKQIHSNSFHYICTTLCYPRAWMSTGTKHCNEYKSITRQYEIYIWAAAHEDMSLVFYDQVRLKPVLS